MTKRISSLALSLLLAAAPALLAQEWRGGRTATPWFDVDCATEGQGRPVCRGETGPITVLGSLGTRAAAVFDLDNDGDLDIVTNEFNARRGF